MRREGVRRFGGRSKRVAIAEGCHGSCVSRANTGRGRSLSLPLHHQAGAMCDEGIARERLGEDVRYHVSSGAVDDVDDPTLDEVADLVVADVDVLRPLGGDFLRDALGGLVVFVDWDGSVDGDPEFAVEVDDVLEHPCAVREMYSASAVDEAVMGCSVDDQMMGAPFAKITMPDLERRLCSPDA